MDPLTVLFLCGLAALASWRVSRRKRALAAHPEAVRTGLDVLSRIVQSARK